MSSLIDKRIKRLIKQNIKRNYRSLFVILGYEGSKQVPVFKHLLKERKVKSISCFWGCKENSEAFGMKNRDNLTMFTDEEMTEVSSYQYCSYDNIDDLAHCSFNLAVLQDFDALSIQTLTKVIEMVKGGGIIIFLLHDIKIINDLKKLNLCVEYKPSRFCERFATAFSSCRDSIILDGNLSVLSVGAKCIEIPEENSVSVRREKLQEIRQNYENDAVIKSLLGICHTHEQAELLLKFLDVIKKKPLHTVCSVSSPVGRGKSAALGLAIAGSLIYNYSNIYISSMYLNNVQSLFKFLLLGLDALNYKEDQDFDLIESINPKFKNALIGINVFRDHPQSVRFILPGDIGQKLEQAELVVFDEAAAIPLQILKPLFGPYVVLMASSISGPGATNCFLYNSMVNAIQSSFSLPHESDKFQKYTLEEPIHYSSGDNVESWMNHVLQTGLATTALLSCGFPVPDQCRLFYVNRDVLFNGSSESENFLKALVAVLSSSTRVIYPNHLLELADSPNLHIFCLLAPINYAKIIPEIICAVMVHLEAEIPEQIFHCGSNLNESVSHCFNHWKTRNKINQARFLPMQGIHILNIVTHKSYRKMGYGMHAFQLLQKFYEGKCISLVESMDIKCNVNENPANEESMNVDSESKLPLLQQLTEVQPDYVDYILVTCNLTTENLRFWRKASLIPAFLTSTVSSEGEHTVFMIKGITERFHQMSEKIWSYFQKNFYVLLGSVFKHFPVSMALNLVHFSVDPTIKKSKGLTKADIDVFIRPHRMKSLVKYAQNLQDFHSIVQFIPTLANLYFKNYCKDISLSRVQEAILLSFGLQFKHVDDISKDLGLPNMQIYGLFNRTIKKIVKYLNDILEKSVEKMLETPEVIMEPVAEDLEEELEEAAKKIQEQQEIDAKKLLDIDVSQYTIKGSEDDWQKALFSGRKTLVSIKSIKKTSDNVETFTDQYKESSFKKSKKQKQRR